MSGYCPACKMTVPYLLVWGEKCRRCTRRDHEAIKRQMEQATKYAKEQAKRAAAVGEGEA